jgi:hypothetical protein
MLGFGSSPLEILAAEAMLRGEIFCQNFTYSAAFLTGTGSALGAAGTTTVPIQINQDSDFVVQAMQLQSWTAADTPEVDPDYLATLTVAGSGRQLMNQAQHVLTLMGSYAINKFPNRLPFPYLLTANTTFNVQLQNRSATAANRVDVSFTGFKVFYTGGDRTQIFHVL